jgi:hypothetical protein
MCLPYRGQYKASLHSVGVLQGTKNDSLLIKIEANSLHSSIAITRSPLRVAGEATMTTILSNRRSKFGITCIQCSNTLIAPERSEYRNERQVRHLWYCWECDFCFESVVSFPAETNSMKDIKTGDVIFPSLFPSLLVA